MDQEKRQYERYDKDITINLNFPYDAAAKLKYQVESKDHNLKKYAGISKNISANGLCFSSHHKLEKGQNLRLEVFLPRAHDPIHMEGEVCWCRSANSEKKLTFDAGIKLKAVEGEAVDATIHLDETHQVVWSNVLEAIFGTFRKLVNKKLGASHI